MIPAALRIMEHQSLDGESGTCDSLSGERTIALPRLPDRLLTRLHRALPLLPRAGHLPRRRRLRCNVATYRRPIVALIAKIAQQAMERLAVAANPARSTAESLIRAEVEVEQRPAVARTWSTA